MYFNYLNKRDSASLIIYSQDKDILSNTTSDILKVIFDKDERKDIENNPDILELNLKDSDKLSIGIDEIKNILPRFQLKPLMNLKKVLIISEAEKLTRDAQGGLLKTIEEPQSGSFIIIKTTNINSLLGTIKSRCDIINLNGGRLRSEYISNILAENLSSRLKIVNQILLIKDPREKRENIEKLFNQIFQELKENTINISNDKKYLILNSVFKYQEYYKSEVNLRLALENLMISLFKILKY